MLQVVITGATGFIGQAVCKELLSRGIPLVAVSRIQQMPPALLELAHQYPSSFQFHPVKDYATLQSFPNAVCIHLASENHISTVEEAPEAVRSSELQIARHLEKLPFQKLVFASSAAVYGDLDPRPHLETDPPK